MKNLTNLVTLVTGANQGLGKAIARTLAQAGAYIIVSGLDEKKSGVAAEEIRSFGGKAKAMVMDVGSEKSIKSTIEEIVASEKKIDIVVNNAGIDMTVPIEKLSPEQIDRIIRVNLLGPFLTSKYALEAMYRQSSGHIVNIASTGSMRAWPNASAYNASKWGLIGLNRALYTEARLHNVRVSAVVPGGMRTPFILERFPDTPLGNLQEPDVVAETVKFVLQIPEASIIPEVMILPLQETSWP